MNTTVKSRDRIEIIARILEVISAGEIYKSRIMYGALISRRQLAEYLKFLTERGLLGYKSEEGTYGITPEGMYFLNIYQDMKSILQSREFSGLSLAA